MMRFSPSIPILILIFLLFEPIDAFYKVRKVVKTIGNRRSIADDDLDLAAAELVFNEKNPLKPLTSEPVDRIQGPPRKLPFGTEHAKENEKTISAPAAEPTFSELKATKVDDDFEGHQENKKLKSSMVGNVNDGETSDSRVLQWQKPLPSHGRQIAYDFNVNPEYPQFAPRARGLVGIPDGWNMDKQVDEEFRSGFRNVDFRRRRVFQ